MRRAAALALAFAISAAIAAGASHVAGNPGGGGLASCDAPSALLTIEPPLTHVAMRIERGEPLTVVAVGSSSTQGVGASAPAMNYPSRLEAELRQRLPVTEVRVINRGKSGEDAPEELARLQRDVIAEHPDLVIWQVGTNAVLRRDDLAADAELIRRGVAQLSEAPDDVVLMDLQYAPRVLARPAFATMEQLLGDRASRMHVGLFRRFDIMRHWQEAAADGQPQAIGPDGLHMNDRGYGCLAADLAEAIARNWHSHRPAARLERTAGMAPRAGQLPATAPLPVLP